MESNLDNERLTSAEESQHDKGVAATELEIGGRKLRIETGRIANQADGAALVRYGDTMILATAVMSKQPREDVDYFPLLLIQHDRRDFF